LQEDIENKTVTLVINGSKFTGNMLKNAISKLLAHQKSPKEYKNVMPHGKQTVRQLAQQNQGISNIEIKDKSIKEFERIARKYGVDFAVKRVKGDDPKFLVFFKGRDADALTSAFREYTAKKIRKEERPSVLKQLQEAVAAKTDPTKIKHKEHSL